MACLLCLLTLMVRATVDFRLIPLIKDGTALLFDMIVTLIYFTNDMSFVVRKHKRSCSGIFSFNTQLFHDSMHIIYNFIKLCIFFFLKLKFF
jgi:hypothetical protein